MLKDARENFYKKQKVNYHFKHFGRDYLSKPRGEKRYKIAFLVIILILDVLFVMLFVAVNHLKDIFVLQHYHKFFLKGDKTQPYSPSLGSTGFCFCVSSETGVKVEGTEVRGMPTNCEINGKLHQGFAQQTCKVGKETA